MADCVLIKENWSEMSILEQQHCKSDSQATSWRQKSHSASTATEVIFILVSAYTFVCTFLPQWLPVISKKVFKWVLYLVVSNIIIEI